MKMNNHSKKQTRGLKSEAPPGGFRACLRAFCLTWLLLCLHGSPAIARLSPGQPGPNNPSPSTLAEAPTDTTADSNSQIAEEPPARNWLIAKSPTTDIGRKLWQTRITLPNSNNDTGSNDDLRRIIELIRSVEFKPRNTPPKPLVTLESPAQPEPNETAAEPSPGKNAETQQIKPKPRPGMLSEETLQILAKQLQNPEQIKNPFDLAEVLFHSGRLKEAAVCYQQVLLRADPNQPAGAWAGQHDPNRQIDWILFQIGNCLRNDDPPKAMEVYSRLCNDHAGSMWADLAKARSMLLSWYRQDEPRKLIEQNRRQTTDYPNENDHVLTTESQPKTEQAKGG
jgi:tetratricopeptide (TPR) repeat protein